MRKTSYLRYRQYLMLALVLFKIIFICTQILDVLNLL